VHASAEPQAAQLNICAEVLCMRQHSHPSSLPAIALCHCVCCVHTHSHSHSHSQAYDSGDGMFAARLWWMLTVVGHPAAYVLEGGW
jgi:hypothetical protein